MTLEFDTCAKTRRRHGEQVCGVRAEIMDHGGVTGFIVDGLGSGFSAKMLSDLIANMIRSLIEGGTDYLTAAEMVAVGIQKGGSGNYSSFSLFHTDETGKTGFAVFNMPAPIVLHKGKSVNVVMKKTGRKAEISTAEVLLRNNDFVLINNSGLLAAESGNRDGLDRPLLERYAQLAYTPEISAVRLAELVTRVCLLLAGGQPEEDAALVTLRARCRRE